MSMPILLNYICVHGRPVTRFVRPRPSVSPAAADVVRHRVLHYILIANCTVHTVIEKNQLTFIALILFIIVELLDTNL